MARVVVAGAWLLGLCLVVAAPAGAQPAGGVWRTFFAGDGLQLPSGVAVDSAHGWVYAVDTVNSRVVKLSAGGAVLGAFGVVGTGTGELRRPRGAVVDPQGVVVVADTANFRVQRYSSSGEALSAWGEIGSAPGEFILPESVTVDDQGNVYVADTGNHRIQELSADGQSLALWSSGLQFPHALALDGSGHLLVADAEGLKEFADGQLVRWWNEFSDPYGVALDPEGNIFVADTDRARVVELSPDGDTLAAWGSEGSGPGQFKFPEAIAIDASGRVYVADRGNNRIQVLVR
jgi:DNA-binding beta-propeller fold protein YncE